MMKRTNAKRIFKVSCSLVLALSMQLAVYAQCGDRCRLPPRSERGDCSIVVDANTGSIVEGSIRIPDKCEQVAVYYVDKNPFKYSYTFTSQFVPFDTETALAFLKLIPDLSALVAPKAAATPPPGASACTDDAEALMVFQKKAGDLKDDSDDIAKKINAAVAIYNAYKDALTKFFNDTDSDNAFRYDSASCTSLCGDAQARLDQYAKLEDLDALSKRVDNLEAELAELEKDVLAFRWKSTDCADEVKNKIIHGEVTARRKELKTYRDKLAELKTVKATLDQKTKIVKAGASESFVELVPAQRDDFRGGKLTLTIARKNLRNPDVTLDNRTVTLLIGEPGLFLSAGIGFSTISDRKIIRQAGLVPDGQGGTKLGTVFGFEENSNFKPSGVIMLDAPLYRFDLFGAKKGASIGPSAGLVLSNRNNTVEPEFIVALSLGLLRDTVFISGGFHAARRENLAPGFKFGQEVPADLKDPLPVEKSFTGGAMFSITYRIK